MNLLNIKFPSDNRICVNNDWYNVYTVGSEYICTPINGKCTGRIVISRKSDDEWFSIYCMNVATLEQSILRLHKNDIIKYGFLRCRLKECLIKVLK